MRILRIILFVLFLLLIPAAGASAQDAIKIEALDQPIKSESIGDFINRFYNTAIGIAVIAAVLMIVVGAIYFTVSGALDKKKEGKDIITSAIWGIVILLGATLILKTINPQILRLVEEGGPARGPTVQGFSCNAWPGVSRCQEGVLPEVIKDEKGNPLEPLSITCCVAESKVEVAKKKSCGAVLSECQSVYDIFWNEKKSSYVLDQTMKIPTFGCAKGISDAGTGCEDEISIEYREFKPSTIIRPHVWVHKGSGRLRCAVSFWQEPGKDPYQSIVPKAFVLELFEVRPNLTKDQAVLQQGKAWCPEYLDTIRKTRSATTDSKK